MKTTVVEVKIDDEARRMEQFNDIMATIKPLMTTGKGKNIKVVTGSTVVPLSCCFVDSRYQGMRTHKHLNRLKNKWDERKLTPIILVPHPEEYRFAVVDGQGRCLVAPEKGMDRFTDNADQSEVADTFYNLNNGQSLNAATMNRVKAKSKDQIIRLGKHKLFTDALTDTALTGHVNEDLVAKSHAILNDENVCTDTKWMRPYMRKVIITEEDEKLLTDIFNRIYNIHSMIEDAKIAKRIYARTHLISIVPIIAESLDDGFSDQQTMEWIVTFFCGKKYATISSEYNNAAGRGTGKNSSVKIRLVEIKKSYDKYFKHMKALAS